MAPVSELFFQDLDVVIIKISDHDHSYCTLWCIFFLVGHIFAQVGF